MIMFEERQVYPAGDLIDLATVIHKGTSCISN